MILGFASGSMLPIYIMPQWLQSILFLMPFQYLAYIPTQIIIENFTFFEYIKMFLIGIFWIVIIAIINHFIYKIGLKKFESQGG
jgi:ABC-2 type transport system permease protein